VQTTGSVPYANATTSGPSALSIVENSLFIGMENDAAEIEKIKNDLSALRHEIEMSEQEEHATGRSLDVNS